MTTAQTAETRTRPVLRAALVSSLLTGAVAVALSLALGGASGLVGSLVGVALVVGFFLVGHLVLTVLRSVSPALLLLVALLTYGLQVTILLAAYAVFRSHETWSDDVSSTALGLTAIGCTVAWTAGLVVAARRDRTPLFEVGGEGR